jgi:hypothetical protein
MRGGGGGYLAYQNPAHTHTMYFISTAAVAVLAGRLASAQCDAPTDITWNTCVCFRPLSVALPSNPPGRT